MNFRIDDKATLGSILTALRTEGIKTGDVAKAIEGISEKPLRNALKDAGYIFSNKTPKGWHYNGTGVEPVETSIFDYVKRSNMNVKDSSSKVIQSNTTADNVNEEVTAISPAIHSKFTSNEINDLMDMLQEWRMDKAAAKPVRGQESKAVHERIKVLPSSDKTRKTIVINKAIGERLDKYCQTEKVNKSDVLHLAIMDFLDRQEKGSRQKNADLQR